MAAKNGSKPAQLRSTRQFGLKAFAGDSSKPKLAAIAAAPAPSCDDLVAELFEIDALINGADSIVRDIQETGTGPAGDLDYDALNAHKLLREAIRRIPLLAESIQRHAPPQASRRSLMVKPKPTESINDACINMLDAECIPGVYAIRGSSPVRTRWPKLQSLLILEYYSDRAIMKNISKAPRTPTTAALRGGFRLGRTA